MKTTYYILTKDVDNIQFDRRYKYGLPAIAVFRLGTRFIRQSYEDGTRDRLLLSEGNAIEYFFENSDFWKSIFCHLKEVKPTFEEMARDIVPNRYVAIEIFKILIKYEKLYFSDILMAADLWEKQCEEKEHNSK